MNRFCVQVTGATACLALTLAGCTAQQQHAAQPVTKSAHQAAQSEHEGYGSHDFVGKWTCNVTNGKYTVIATSTIRANGTSVGSGAAYGHTTPTYENSWYYAPSGPTTGVMSANNMAFAPPHYSETSLVTWKSSSRFHMVTLTDTPNVKAIGSQSDCVRKP